MRHRIDLRGLLALLASCVVLAACWVAPPLEQGQRFDARKYFQGQALALAQAVDRRDADAVRRLIHDEGVDPDAIFDEHAMPLVAWPILNENAEGLRLLLENGADPNARRINRKRPSHSANNALVYAAGLEDQAYLNLLLDHGGDPNTVNSNDEALTYVARLKGQWPNVQLLIERGANVNYSLTSSGDNTVMAWYARLGDFEEVYWLLQHGGDPTVKTTPPPEYTGTENLEGWPILEAIYYLPVKPRVEEWQRKCQVWLREHGIARPPMPEFLRKRRAAFGLPTDDKDIPLP
jgi:ankyrin repeat protein